jgi:hypothetical protein
MDDQVSYNQAKRRVRRLRGFYLHLTIYVLVNALLLAINLVTSPSILWFFWPLLGWGIGIVAHAVSVFGTGPFLGKEWEERKIKQLMDRGESK